MKTEKTVKPKESQVQWTGRKLTGKHYGNIAIKNGFLEFEEGHLVGGEFIIDMKSIDTKDLTGVSKEKLEKHLHSDDFFGTAVYETSTLKIIDVTQKNNIYKVNGNLEIKGQQNPVEFDFNVDEKSATTEFNIDRTQYDIRFASKKFFKKMVDKTVNDEFTINVNLKF